MRVPHLLHIGNPRLDHSHIYIIAILSIIDFALDETVSCITIGLCRTGFLLRYNFIPQSNKRVGIRCSTFIRIAIGGNAPGNDGTDIINRFQCSLVIHIPYKINILVVKLDQSIPVNEVLALVTTTSTTISFTDGIKFIYCIFVTQMEEVSTAIHGKTDGCMVFAIVVSISCIKSKRNGAISHCQRLHVGYLFPLLSFSHFSHFYQI